MALSDVINLTISRSAPPVSRQGFGKAVIMGPNFPAGLSPAIQKSYTASSGLATMLSDGFTTSHAEYKAAAALLGQTNKPATFQVGKRTSAVAQVNTGTPDTSTQSVQHYIATINGTAYDFTSDSTPTAAEVVTGLTSLINGDSGSAVTATGTNTLILTANQAGIAFTVTGSTNLPFVATTANNGPVEDLTAVFAADNSAYAVVLCSQDDNEILVVAAYVETLRKIFVVSTGDSGVLGSGTTDIAYKLKAKSYARTAYMYSSNHAAFPEAAWLGTFLPLQPGAYNSKFQTLAGITADDFTGNASGYSNAKGKNANLYDLVDDAGMTEEGVMASGDYIDNIIGIDWIYANTQSDVYQQFKNAAALGTKIPYTDVGFAAIQSTVQNRLRLAERAGILADGSSVVTVVPVAQQDPADVAARRMGGITFTATLAGAVNETVITGSVVD